MAKVELLDVVPLEEPTYCLLALTRSEAVALIEVLGATNVDCDEHFGDTLAVFQALVDETGIDPEIRGELKVQYR